MERLKCEIRAVTEDDRGALLLLADETLLPRAEGYGHPERYREGDVLALLDRADAFVATAGGEVAGFVAVERDGTDLAVRCVCVHPAFEARGVANQLLDWAEGLAIERRATRLTAEVPAGDKPSLHLYRGHAFTTAGERREGELLLLEKRLPASD